MNKADIVILLIDKNKDRLKTFEAKLKPFGYSVISAKDLEHGLKLTKTIRIHLAIVDQEVFESNSEPLSNLFHKYGQVDFTLYLLAKAIPINLREYYAQGIAGVFEKSIDARTLLTAIRKSTVPLNLQWQVTLNQMPVESVSYIGDTLDSIQQSSTINFGSGGFSMQFDKDLKVGDRIGYSFYFEQDGQNYVIQGIAVVRWHDKNTSWAGVEFESMMGQGVVPFIKWLEQNKFLEFIPLAS